MPESIQVEEELFTAALALPPEERTGFVGRACGDDRTLRERVESLLANADSAAAFVNRQQWGHGELRALSGERDDGEFGPYKLLHEIGEGGCGEVFLAEQATPVRRQVALKIIKLGMDTKAVISRFGAEQRALALMDHPNIAKVLDAGITPAGRPYFAMELVRGVKITTYCDQARLSINERLALFAQVCLAVQHAHHKGIVHRDIKPSNVLVTLHDGSPMVKVIDFGIAKAIQGRLIDQTLYTALDQFIGTPAYVSPEQLDSDSGQIDCRSDIYSLGVLLHELLTGCTPFEMPAPSVNSLDEFRRRIRLEEPPIPSKRLRTLSAEARTAAALCRRTTANRLIKQVDGDLDWIVMRCLEKAPERRYSGADHLADEAQRVLRHEPVLARPPSVTYALRRLAKRHRVIFAAAGSVMLVLMLATAVSAWLAVRAYRAEQRARTEAAAQRALSSFLRNDVLAQASPDSGPNRDLTLRAVLDDAATRIQGRFAGQPLVEAAIRTTLAETYQSLGEYAAAEAHFRRALLLNQRELGGTHRSTLYVARKVVGALADQGQYQKAEALGRQVLATHQQTLGSTDPDTLDAKYNLAVPLFNKGERVVATQMLVETLRDYQLTLGPRHPDTLKVMDGLAEFYLTESKPSDAQQLLLQALRLRREAFGETHPTTIDVMSNLAAAYADMSQFDQAEPLMKQTVTLRQRILGVDHPATLSSMNNLATLYADQGRFAESAELQARTIELGQKKMGAEHPRLLIWMNNLGMTYLDEQRFDDAYRVLSRTLEARRKLLGAEHPQTLVSMSSVGFVQHRRGRLADAEALLSSAWSASERVFGADDADHLAIGERLAGVWIDRKKFAAAESLLRSISDTRRDRFPDDWRTYSTLAQLGQVLVTEGRYGEAEPLLATAYRELTLRARKIPDNQQQVLKRTADFILKLHAIRNTSDQRGREKPLR